MFAAGNVGKIRPGPRLRPAMKNSPACARRPIHKPSATKRVEYARRTASANEPAKLFQIPGRGVAWDTGGRPNGANDRLGHGIGRQRAKLIEIGASGTRAGGERE